MKKFNTLLMERLRAQFDATTFAAFIQPTSLHLQDNKLTISAPNKATERWLRENVEQTLMNIIDAELDCKPSLHYHINESAATSTGSGGAITDTDALPEASLPPPAQEVHDRAGNINKSNNLPARNTFANFIPGRANEIPLVAAKKISKGENAVNPLFIYGSTGLGKTHLMHAIGNDYQRNFPHRRVLYITARAFMNEVVHTFRLNQHDQFKRRFQRLDMLLIDDIQYIGGDKVRTQEEFFFLFNTLYEEDKTIIISCDRAPTQIKNLPQRLTTRFNAGLPTHITPPEFELRTEIVRYKAKQNKLVLDDDVVFFIAENVKSNVRELEGAVNRVRAMAEFQGEKPTLKMCRRVMADLVGQSNILITPDAIKEKVASFYLIRTSDLSSQKRLRSIVIPRHIAIYLCRQMTNLSLPEIGRHFGKRNHTTVLHSCRWVEEKIKSTPNLWDEIKQLEIMLKD